MKKSKILLKSLFKAGLIMLIGYYAMIFGLSGEFGLPPAFIIFMPFFVLFQKPSLLFTPNGLSFIFYLLTLIIYLKEVKFTKSH